MVIPNEIPPIVERCQNVEGSHETIQAGRSGSSLHAERNLAELRNGKPSSPTTPSRNSKQLSLNTNPRRPSTAPSERPNTSPAASVGRRASFAPKTPSPLNPSTSISSISTNGSRKDDNSDSLENSAPSDGGQQAQNGVEAREGRKPSKRGSRPNTSLTPMQQLLRQKSIPIIRPQKSGYGGLSDNYSRYPFRPQTSRRNSRTPEPTRSSSAAYLLTARSSVSSSRATNPFSDTTLLAENKKWSAYDNMSTFSPYYAEEKGFILYVDEVEDDDDDHMPKEKDDITFKLNFSDYFHHRSIVSTIGAIFLIIGLLTIFIILPILFFTGTARIQLPGADYNWFPSTKPTKTWATVNDRTYPLLSKFRKGLIDPDTPASAMTRKSTFDGEDLKLVFSDEFNQNNRTFYPGDDPFWTAPNIWYGATQDMDWYDPDAVTTYEGTLQLRLDRFPNHNFQYRSGMLNSWNQLCFKGGVFEVSLSLPGPAGVPGLWPGVWSMGNLGRPGYKASTEGLWPYTYNSCDLGITPNQSSPDGLSHLPGQKLPSCTCPDEDHPNPGTGRGAPEIDILEASVDPTNFIGVVTQSFQVAPFDVYYRPNSDFLQIPNYNTTSMNGYCGGPFQQAISGTTLLNNGWYDGQQYQKYAFEYQPGTNDGKIAWFVGEDRSFTMDGRAIGQNGNVAPRVVSEEPMSMVLNLGISPAWGEILLDKLKFPTIMRIDYVRIYQRPTQESITCDPPGYPTTDYIKKHPIAYNNPNLTAWNETGYAWPRNQMISNC